MKWQRIDDILTPDGIKNLKSGLEGDILIFNHKKAGPIHLKIRRKTKDGKVFAERTYAYTPEEADAEVTIVKET